MKVRTIAVLVLIVVTGLGLRLSAGQSGDIRQLKLGDWQPRSMLKTKQSVVERPAFGVIDVHNHLGAGAERLTADRVGDYLAEMDAAGVQTGVNLDGGWGEKLKQTLSALDQAHPSRFLTFALLDYSGIDDENWGRREAGRLEESFRAGAKGLKIHKTLGLGHRYKNGKLMPVDDPKLDPVWQMCAKYDRPVVIHVADPAAFFTPLDRFNERWHELGDHPNWLFHGDRFPSRDEILAQRNRAIAKHPKTTFICAHFANNPEDLAAVGTWLDSYPNMYIDVDARISELGRQPYTSRKFFLKHQDRIMFGSDLGVWVVPTDKPRTYGVRYTLGAPMGKVHTAKDLREYYYRQWTWLETGLRGLVNPTPIQGRWRVHGISLPRAVLRKIYRENALRVFRIRPRGRSSGTRSGPPAPGRPARGAVPAPASR